MDAPVLAAVDGSPESLAAARWAADEALRRGVRLRLLYAWPWPQHAAPGLPGVSEVRGRALGMLADAADWLRAAHPGLDVGTVLVHEHAPGGITAAGASADLLVLGSAAPHGPLGSVGLSVASRATCPVVLVRAAPGTHGPPRDVVVGVDAHDPAEAVLNFARRTALASDVPLRVVYAWTPPPWWWALTAVERALRTEREESALADVLGHMADSEAVTDVQRAGATDALAGAARSAGLLVVGRSGRHLGPVARAVIHRSWCPIAVVPHD